MQWCFKEPRFDLMPVISNYNLDRGHNKIVPLFCVHSVRFFDDKQLLKCSRFRIACYRQFTQLPGICKINSTPDNTVPFKIGLQIVVNNDVLIFVYPELRQILEKISNIAHVLL